MVLLVRIPPVPTLPLLGAGAQPTLGGTGKACDSGRLKVHQLASAGKANLVRASAPHFWSQDTVTGATETAQSLYTGLRCGELTRRLELDLQRLGEAIGESLEALDAGDAVRAREHLLRASGAQIGAQLAAQLLNAAQGPLP